MISIVVPIYNEEATIKEMLEDLEKEMVEFDDYEIIGVNDGSTDETQSILSSIQIKNFRVINHVENLGYGKSLFDGITIAKYDCIGIIDGDGTYPARYIKELYKHFGDYDMVVGARSGSEYKRGVFKRPARFIFNRLCEYATGRNIPDVNSGLRIFRRDVPIKHQQNICAGFSFTTTITLLFFLNHYLVKYIPIDYLKRDEGGKSKVNHWKDTLRAAQIIIEIILEYNPTKLALLFATISLLAGLALGVINALTIDSLFLTIASAVSFASFIPVFVIGLVRQSKRTYLTSSFGDNKRVNN